MKYRLAIANRVCVTVKGKIAGEARGAFVNVNFTLDMERVDQEQIRAALAGGESIEDFIVGKAKGWDGQRLVLDGEDRPADYCEEALRVLLRHPGMAVFVWQSYMRDLGVQEKN